MLTRKPDAQMDFDFAKVVEASKDNPVFYVQYATRGSLDVAQGGGGRLRAVRAEHLALLGAEELDLVKLAAQFPRIVEAAAIGARAAPHRFLPA
jgi:arginyl-tRNA synthetase